MHNQQVQTHNAITFVEPRLLKNTVLPKPTRNFVRESPLIRLTILGLVLYAAKQVKSGMRVLDVGAGDSPYRTLFSHVEYKSTDFAQTSYHSYHEIDYACPADNIPVQEESFDALLCTEVLEHVPNPQAVLAEFHRILKNDGHLFMTIPFLYMVHEEPYDFYRYTPYTLTNLLREAGFEIVFLTARGGWVATIANAFGRHDLRPTRKNIFPYYLIFLPLFLLPMLLVRALPLNVVAWLDKMLDTEQKETLGYALHARKVSSSHV